MRAEMFFIATSKGKETALTVAGQVRVQALACARKTAT
jgi:hypothetical protein